ncbi:MAG: Tfp pilus assembly protein FimT/FimU [Micropepsaceae bacterium]
MRHGYSLLELIVVFGIVALLIVVATPTVQASVERITLRADARTVLTALRRLRGEALDRQADMVLSVAGNTANEIVATSGDTISLTPGTVAQVRDVVIAWDGTITGTLTLMRGDAQISIAAEPLTGRPTAEARQ